MPLKSNFLFAIMLISPFSEVRITGFLVISSLVLYLRCFLTFNDLSSMMNISKNIHLPEVWLFTV